MVVDTSALVAIAQNEPERQAFVNCLAESKHSSIAAVTWMETRMVLLSRMGDLGLNVLRDLMTSADISIVPVTRDLSDAAFTAFRRYGRGRHAAGLNFGDCFAYALAKTENQKLLFKGADFASTDVMPAATVR